MGNTAIKRMFDATAAVLGLITLFPLLLATSVAVAMTSKGPVFYLQERVGQGGRNFSLIKFRSMSTDAEKAGRLTPAGDPRITKLGRFIRKTNLDELPQLWNVLKGDLSLVGPRPEVPEFVNISDHRWAKVLRVRPGMTSPETLLFRQEGEILATYGNPEQGYREEVLPKKLNLAIQYVDTYTFWGDISVILRTLWDIVRRH